MPGESILFIKRFFVGFVSNEAVLSVPSIYNKFSGNGWL